MCVTLEAKFSFSLQIIYQKLRVYHTLYRQHDTKFIDKQSLVLNGEVAKNY